MGPGETSPKAGQQPASPTKEATIPLHRASEIFSAHAHLIAFTASAKRCDAHEGVFFLISKRIFAQKDVKCAVKNTAFNYSLLFSFPLQELFMEVIWGTFLCLLRFLASLW